MPPGPILMFDKSFLHSLNPDEAVWLDFFFLTGITPLFFVETLADLEREVSRGRTPEQVVGNLAYKTPDLQSNMITHHSTLLWAELNGYPIPMDGRIPRAGGQLVVLDGQQGVLYEMSKEEEAFARWQDGEFLDLERQIAKVWRRDVSNIDHSFTYGLFKEFYRSFRRPNNLEDAKRIADTLIDLLEEEKAFRFGLAMLGFPSEVHEQVLQRWIEHRRPPLREYAPYFRYVFSVDFFFHLAIAADLISRVRPAGKADNKVDIAYLYYLPFCMVFVSNDNLHERVVPLFLRDDQSFVKGPELKADLKKIDEHYARLPDEVKQQGLYKFVTPPTEEVCPLVTRLWDMHLNPGWHDHSAEHEDRSPEEDQATIDMIDRAEKESLHIDPAAPPHPDDIAFTHISRRIIPRKGKWIRVRPPGAEPVD